MTSRIHEFKLCCEAEFTVLIVWTTEERQLQVDARILNRYVKKHIKGPRAVEGLKPTTYIVRQTYEVWMYTRLLDLPGGEFYLSRLFRM